jgi:hypothetical protein
MTSEEMAFGCFPFVAYTVAVPIEAEEISRSLNAIPKFLLPCATRHGNPKLSINYAENDFFHWRGCDG